MPTQGIPMTITPINQLLKHTYMSYTPSGADCTLIAIEKVKKNDFFRLSGGKQVYQAEGYCRMNKKYCGSSYDDISKCTYKKKGTLVEIDFDF